MAQGIVYIVNNPALPGMIKIGRTTNLRNRLEQLGQNFPHPFEVYFALEVEDMETVERLLHDAFADHRVRKDKEFFEIEPRRVASALKLALGRDVTPNNNPPPHDNQPNSNNIEELILDFKLKNPAMTNQQIADEVLKIYPHARTSYKSVSSTISRARKAGLL